MNTESVGSEILALEVFWCPSVVQKVSTDLVWVGFVYVENKRCVPHWLKFNLETHQLSSDEGLAFYFP